MVLTYSFLLKVSGDEVYFLLYYRRQVDQPKKDTIFNAGKNAGFESKIEPPTPFKMFFLGSI